MVGAVNAWTTKVIIRDIPERDCKPAPTAPIHAGISVELITHLHVPVFYTIDSLETMNIKKLESYTPVEMALIGAWIAIAIGVVFILLVFSINQPVSCEECDARNNACRDFARHVDGLSVGMCVAYLETNPDSTGRQMLDHYSIQTFDDILDGPVVPGS